MKVHKYKVDQEIIITEKCEIDLKNMIGKKGVITGLYGGLAYDYLADIDGKEIKVGEWEFELVEDENVSKPTYFEELGTKTGKLVDEKQLAYGDSVGKTFDLMKIYLQNWRNEDGTYTIPESLLKHILLQVRIIDKQNRIFNNPDGDLMEENPYSDTVGYGMLGVRMCDKGGN